MGLGFGRPLGQGYHPLLVPLAGPHHLAVVMVRTQLQLQKKP
jgi:hypothetical protein